MASRLRMGVIGLGRRWPRYRRALLALRRLARVRAVCDPSAGRAEDEARALGCAAAGGVVELLQRDDIDAVLLLGGAWFGLWPLEQAARLGRPVFCAASPPRDEAAFARLPADAAAHVVLWPALELAAEALGERLGRPTFLAAQRVGRDGGDGAAVALAAVCARLAGTDPVRVQAVGVPAAAGFAALTLDFGDGRVAQVTLWSEPAARPDCALRIEAADGSGRLELPGWLEWHDAEGRHTHRLPAGMAELLDLERFVLAVREGRPLGGLGEARRALGWLTAARRSLAEGGAVAVG